MGSEPLFMKAIKFVYKCFLFLFYSFEIEEYMKCCVILDKSFVCEKNLMSYILSFT